MHTSGILFAAAAIVAVSFNAVSAARDADQENQVLVGSVPSSGRVKRFLRANKAVNDDEERVAPGTGQLDFTKSASLNTLDDVAADLAAIRGSGKFIKPLQVEKDWALIKVAVRKWTPERVDEVLDTAAKRATMTVDQLKGDPDYLFAKQYREFWNARKAQA